MSTTTATIDPERQMLGEVEVIGQERWEEIRRRAGEGASIRAIARALDLDRKTVRRCLRQTEWKPYQRAPRVDTLLATHAEYLRRRAAEVGYSAQVLFQELRGRQYRGSYETVKRFVRPLRETQLHAGVTRTRFETPPGLQSQIDWGQARVWLGAQRQVRHVFVLTLGFSRRSFYVPCLSETLGELLDAHEQAFTHFGGRTQEHLYDRPRTVCAPRGSDGVRWNTTFKAFADFWGFEPRLCRPYRAQTKGKVESGVKYLKRNFLAGRRFRDDLDFNEQLQEWMATVADVRVHGTTHERPMDRFARERDALIPAPPGRAFRLEAPLTRVVATDYLVTVDTNRYSVPFTLIGQPVEVMRRDGFLQMRHRGQVVATHPVLAGRHQLRILPGRAEEYEVLPVLDEVAQTQLRPRDRQRDPRPDPTSRDDDQHPGRFVSAEGQVEVGGGQADHSGSVSDGSLWTLPALWTRRRAHNALDRPQTACPQPPQALISSLFSTRGWGNFR